MKQPEILIEEISPHGNVIGVAEQYERSCYFYLYGKEPDSLAMKSCWVRNFSSAPEQLDIASMRQGEAPMLPRQYCRHPIGASRFRPGDLAIIWAEEGDAAALACNGEMLAVIPGWSGENDFHGYARDCLGQSPLCWELGTPDTNAQFERFQRATSFWRSWAENPGPWPELQTNESSALERCFGKASNYYAIDGGHWPPMAMFRFQGHGVVILATVGVCIRPQPMVERHFEDPVPHRRIELGIGLDASLTDDAIMQLARYISAQTNLPWLNFTFLGAGHTIPSDVVTELSNGRLSFVLLINRSLGMPLVQLPAYRNDPVNILWMIPIYESEQLFAVANGSMALAARLEQAGVNWIASFNRDPIC